MILAAHSDHADINFREQGTRLLPLLTFCRTVLLLLSADTGIQSDPDVPWFAARKLPAATLS
jgi:hypothetical protein